MKRVEEKLRGGELYDSRCVVLTMNGITNGSRTLT